jgi:hypothetical protein
LVHGEVNYSGVTWGSNLTLALQGVKSTNCCECSAQGSSRRPAKTSWYSLTQVFERIHSVMVAKAEASRKNFGREGEVPPIPKKSASSPATATKVAVR